VPEGLSQVELSSTIAERAQASGAASGGRDGREGWISIVEAVLLSLVAVLAAYSGFAAAKWATHSSVALARASSLRTQAGRDDALALVTRTLDSSSFNAWFTAFSQHNKQAERVAIRRLRPGFRRAFDAWLATDPAHDPNSPPGPSYMPQYVIPQERSARRLDARADAAYDYGEHAGSNSDDYIRDTVFLASVLFLVGISGQFRIRAARYGLVTVGGLIMLFAVLQLATLAPPS
jgi:hypothetical protein